MSRYKQEYYKGETITMRLSGGEELNLDSVDFSIIIGSGRYKKRFEKVDIVREAENMYLLKISSEESIDMPVGSYDIELQIKKEDDVMIEVVENVLVLKNNILSRDE